MVFSVGGVSRHLDKLRLQLCTEQRETVNCRYLFTDDLLSAVRASPGNKVATLSRSSLALVNAVRADIEAQLPIKQVRVRCQAVTLQDNRTAEDIAAANICCSRAGNMAHGGDSLGPA